MIIIKVFTWRLSSYRNRILWFPSHLIFGSQDVFLIFVELAFETFDVFVTFLEYFPSWWRGYIIWQLFLILIKKIFSRLSYWCSIFGRRSNRLWSSWVTCNRGSFTNLTKIVSKMGDFLALLNTDAEVLNVGQIIASWCKITISFWARSWNL